jgi:hypothetical protein
VAHVVLRAQAALPKAMASTFDAACRAEDWATLRRCCGTTRRSSLTGPPTSYLPAPGPIRPIRRRRTAAGTILTTTPAPGGCDGSPGCCAAVPRRGSIGRCRLVLADRTCSRNLAGELSIAYAEAVLDLLDQDRTPEPWSRTMHNLGTTYQQRARGRRADTSSSPSPASCGRSRSAPAQDAHEVGADHTQPRRGPHPPANRGPRRQPRAGGRLPRAALEVFTREATPDEWAMAMDNLGAVHQQRVAATKLTTLNRRSPATAAPYGSSAKPIHRCSRRPPRWPCLATVRGSRAAKPRTARRRPPPYAQAPDAPVAPLDWAKSQHNLGVACLQRSHGTRVETSSGPSST